MRRNQINEIAENLENEIKKSYFSKFPDLLLYLTKDVKVKRPSLEDYSWDEIKEIADKNLEVTDSEGASITQIDICKDNWGYNYVELG